MCVYIYIYIYIYIYPRGTAASTTSRLPRNSGFAYLGRRYLSYVVIHKKQTIIIVGVVHTKNDVHTHIARHKSTPQKSSWISGGIFENGFSVVVSHLSSIVSGMFQRIVTSPVHFYWKQNNRFPAASYNTCSRLRFLLFVCCIGCL